MNSFDDERNEEMAEEQAVFNKYYDLLTDDEKFGLAEEAYLDDSFDDNWFLVPKLILENRNRKINK